MLEFLEDMYDEGKLIWEKGGRYKITYENDEIYHIDSEQNEEIYGIDKKSNGKKYVVVEAEN